MAKSRWLPPSSGPLPRLNPTQAHTPQAPTAATLPHPQHCGEERMSDNILLSSKGIPYLPQEGFLNPALHQACIICIVIHV